MKKFLALLVLCMFFAIPAQSYADDADDMAAIPCSDYNTTPDEHDKMLMILWIDGFLGGASDVTETSEAWLTALYSHMNTYCAANPAVTLIDAAVEIEDMEIDGGDALDMPCAEIIASTENPQELTATLMWAEGYLSAKSENTVMDEAVFEAICTHIIQFCANDQSKTLRDALVGQSK